MMDDKAPELIPCKFCKGEAESEMTECTDSVLCKCCGARIVMTADPSNPYQSAIAWNKQKVSDQEENAMKLAKILGMVKITGKKKMRCEVAEDDYCCPYDWFGGNIDDAYHGGIEDGEVKIARNVLAILEGK